MEATGYLIGNEIADKIAKISKVHCNSSETGEMVTENIADREIEIYIYIYIYIYIPER